MSGIVGLDAYTPAPPPQERPAWVVATDDLWARMDGECRPAVLEDANGGGIEITMCDRGEFLCGVSVAATDLLATSHAWCRDDTKQVMEPWTGRVLSLVTADDASAVWRQVVQLSAAPVGFNVESQACTKESLRDFEKSKKKRERAEAEVAAAAPEGTDKKKKGRAAAPVELPPEWAGAQPVFGNRVCIHVEGFEVREGALNSFNFSMNDVKVPSMPGKVDCHMACPVDQIGEFAVANAQVVNKWFHPPGATTIALYRTEQACREATSVEPSGAPQQLCGTLAAGLRP